jgi:hypothetical protein
MRTHSRLNYVFVIADEISRQSADVTQQSDLEHLHNAEEKLAEIFGAHEWSQLLLNELKLSGLPEKTRSALNAELATQLAESSSINPSRISMMKLAERIQKCDGQPNPKPHLSRFTPAHHHRVVGGIPDKNGSPAGLHQHGIVCPTYPRAIQTPGKHHVQRPPSEVRQGVNQLMFRYRPSNQPKRRRKHTEQGKRFCIQKEEKKRH